MPLSNSQVTIIYIFIWFLIERPTDVRQELWRLYANLRAFLSRFLTLACVPRRFAPLVADYWLLVQSIWSGKQSGPDLVYPMLSIRKRQSGHLAKLILEHCRAVRRYKIHAETQFPEGIEPPCVAVVDLDEVPREVVENGYSTQVDVYGLMAMLILFTVMLAFILRVFYPSPHALENFTIHSLIFCALAVFGGEGILTLARRSDTSTPGCALLLDRDFTVILNGNQSVVEAVAESSFNLSHPNFVADSSAWTPPISEEDDGRDLSYDLIEPLCDAACLIFIASCWLLFRPEITKSWSMTITLCCIACGLQSASSLRQKSQFVFIQQIFLRWFPPILLVKTYKSDAILPHFWGIFPAAPLGLLSAGYNARHYPIRSTKLLDALGHPPVRKWQFDTLAAAATFQSLVLCRGMARPIRTIDVLALFDMIILDQRDLWKAWKARVADRIVHETDILFAPTIPTFGDERQQQLKDLLDQAQFGYDTYGRFYDPQ